MQVQDIINASSTDFRAVLSNTSPDSGLFISWVDRIQKDCLHTGMYNYLLHTSGTISVVQGTSNYTIPITSGAVRRVTLVYDRTFDRVLLPIEALAYPTAKGSEQPVNAPLQIPKEMITASTMEQWPEYYHVEGTTITIFPAPQKTAFNGTYEIHYEMQAPDLANTTDTLLIPNDGKDQVVAGVNIYVANFLRLDTEAQSWAQQYQMLKTGQQIQ